MLKIYLANNSDQKIGGGWSFMRNLKKGLAGRIEFVDNLEAGDIYFISSATMVTRDNVVAAREMGKKIVLRIDNIPRNSRNRNTGTSRLYDFAQIADVIVYQSQWARDFIGWFVDPLKKKKEAVILNGVDESIFTPDGPKIEKDGDPQYLYVRYNRDETKRWDEAWFFFQSVFFKNPSAHLWIVGNFSDELKEYKFDFFGGAEERIRFFGIVDSQEELAKIYRSADDLLIPYYNDACSNVLLEALACGLSPEWCRSGYTGGNPEVIGLDDLSLGRMADEYLEVLKKLK